MVPRQAVGEWINRESRKYLRGAPVAARATDRCRPATLWRITTHTQGATVRRLILDLRQPRRGIALGKALLVLGFLFFGSTIAYAAVDEESLFVFNTFSFLVWGGLVM